jgi:hypothetical protein
VNVVVSVTQTLSLPDTLFLELSQLGVQLVVLTLSHESFVALGSVTDEGVAESVTRNFGGACTTTVTEALSCKPELSRQVTVNVVVLDIFIIFDPLRAVLFGSIQSFEQPVALEPLPQIIFVFPTS